MNDIPPAWPSVERGDLMGIENFTRIHWTVLGIFLGVTLAFAWSSTSNNVEGLQRVEASYFERDVISKDTASGLPLISDIVVHPAEYSKPDASEVNIVTYKRLALDKTTQKTGYWLDRWMIAKIPYKPVYTGRVQTPDPSTLTIETYLAELAKQPNQEFVQAKFGWWYIPKNAMIVGGIGGAVLIGGVWPTLLGVMTGAGLGPKKKPKKESLWNYKSKGAEPGKAHKPVVTAADREQLQNVADAYEKNLAGSGLGMTEAGADEAATHAATGTTAKHAKSTTVRVLENKPGEASAPIPESDDEVEVKDREFYPVLVHHKKDEKDAEHHGPKK